MGPIELFKAWRLYAGFQAIEKEKASMTTKITQYLVLAATVAGLFAAYLTGWLNAHPEAFTILVGFANVLAHLFPSIFTAPSAAAEQKAGLTNVKLPVILVVLAFGSLASHAQTVGYSSSAGAQPAAAVATTTPQSASLGFSGESDVLAVHFNGAWSAGTLVTESYDFLDFGATKANHVFLDGQEFLAPTPGESLYLGGITVQPDIGKVLAKTNVPAGAFNVFLGGSVGSDVPSTGTSHIAFLVGGGVKYQLTSNLTWQSLQAWYGHAGSQGIEGISTGLSFIFGGNSH